MNGAVLSQRAAGTCNWQGPASLLGLLAIWQLAALAFASRLFPSPLEVARLLWVESVHGQLLHHLGITLARVGVSLAIALMIGSAIGYTVGRSPAADRWLKPWLLILLNLPALVTVILIYVWLGLTEAALVLAVALNKIPTVAVTVREGANRLDRELGEMAELYNFGRSARFAEVILPQLLPYLLVSARNGLALTWKIVLVAELLGRSDGVGFQLQVYFQNFDVGRILAYTAAFTGAVLAIEYGAVARIEKRLTAWRR
jgi:NitT/TauT family transport system permease protein